MVIANTRKMTTKKAARAARVKVTYALLACLASAPAAAVNLLEAYRLALNMDPAFQSARFDRAAGDEYEALGRANLLPNVGINYTHSSNTADRTITQSNGNRQTDNLQYDTRIASLSLRQPLLNLDAWQRYKGGKAQSKLSEAQFAVRAQDLITRLTTSYLEALLAEDQLRLAIAQRDAYDENQRGNQRLLDMGVGTRTEMLETKARFELARAEVVEAQNNVIKKRNALAIIIGRDPDPLNDLADGLPELPLEHATLEEWESIARSDNPEILAQRYSVEYGRTETERFRAGHYPRVDLVASHSRNTSDSLFAFNQQSTINSVGIQMSVPLYSGGSVNAQTRQAAARLAAGQADLDATSLKVLLEVRTQFQLVSSSRIRMTAMAQAEQSAAEAVEATKKSVTGGQRVNLDILMALQQLFKTRRDLSEARHGYLLAYLRLKAAAGRLTEEDLVKLSVWFKSADS